MREEMRAEAVERELSPRASRAEMCRSSGGVEGKWAVTRRTARRREVVSGVETKAALDAEALSLIAPMRSLNFVILPMDSG